MSEDIKDLKYQILLERHKELLKQNYELKNRKDFLERREELRSKLMADRFKNKQTSNGDDDMNKETNDLLKEILNTLKNNKCECVSTNVEETVSPPSVRFATEEKLNKVRDRKKYSVDNIEFKKKIEERIKELHKKPFDIYSATLLTSYMRALDKINKNIEKEKDYSDLDDC